MYGELNIVQSKYRVNIMYYRIRAQHLHTSLMFRLEETACFHDNRIILVVVLGLRRHPCR